MTARPRKATAAAITPDFATLLAGAKLPEDVVPICMRADLAAEHEKLDLQLEKLIQKPAGKLGGDGRGAIRQRLEELEAEMEAATYLFRLRAMPRPAFRAFVAEHPPRKDPATGEVDERDAKGFNTETFWDALIRRSLLDPELDDEAWTTLAEVLTDKQYSNLADMAWALNRRDVDVPFSRAVWALTRSSESE